MPNAYAGCVFYGDSRRRVDSGNGIGDFCGIPKERLRIRALPELVCGGVRPNVRGNRRSRRIFSNRGASGKLVVYSVCFVRSKYAQKIGGSISVSRRNGKTGERPIGIGVRSRREEEIFGRLVERGSSPVFPIREAFDGNAHGRYPASGVGSGTGYGNGPGIRRTVGDGFRKGRGYEVGYVRIGYRIFHVPGTVGGAVDELVRRSVGERGHRDAGGVGAGCGTGTEIVPLLSAEPGRGTRVPIERTVGNRIADLGKVQIRSGNAQIESGIREKRTGRRSRGRRRRDRRQRGVYGKDGIRSVGSRSSDLVGSGNSNLYGIRIESAGRPDVRTDVRERRRDIRPIRSIDAVIEGNRGRGDIRVGNLGRVPENRDARSGGTFEVLAPVREREGVRGNGRVRGVDGERNGSARGIRKLVHRRETDLEIRGIYRWNGPRHAAAVRDRSRDDGPARTAVRRSFHRDRIGNR